MSNELEALERIIEKTGCLNDTCAHLRNCLKDNKCRYNIDDLMCPDYEMANSIKQTLLKAQENEKVLSIINKKSVYIHLLQQCGDVESYNNYFITKYGLDEFTERLLLTQEEFDLLKRWLG